MSKRTLLPTAVLAAFLVSAACENPVVGTQGMQAPPPPGTAPVTMMVADAPVPGLPPGVTLLSFELQFTQILLQPNNVSLLSTALTIELPQAQTTANFLSTTNVPAGTYTSFTVTVANPTFTILNTSGATIAGCANDTICVFSVPLSTQVAFAASPLPLTVTAGTPTGLSLDVLLNNIIQSDLSLNFTGANAFALTQLQALSGNLAMVDDVIGTVQSVNASANQFVVNTPIGLSFTVTANTNTTFFNFDQIACGNTFSCLAPGQLVELEVDLTTGGTLVATSVDLQDVANATQIEGIIASINTATGQFTIIVHDQLGGSISGLNLGSFVNVSPLVTAVYRIDAEDLNDTNFVSLFASFAGLLQGQEVKVRALSGSNNITIMTDRVSLSMSEFTAQVFTVAAPFFNVDNLPPLFAFIGVSQIQVQTQAATVLENLPGGVTTLNTGDTVTVEGLLFNQATPPLVAEAVRKH